MIFVVDARVYTQLLLQKLVEIAIPGIRTKLYSFFCMVTEFKLLSSNPIYAGKGGIHTPKEPEDRAASQRARPLPPPDPEDNYEMSSQAAAHVKFGVISGWRVFVNTAQLQARWDACLPDSHGRSLRELVYPGRTAGSLHVGTRPQLTEKSEC